MRFEEYTTLVRVEGHSSKIFYLLVEGDYETFDKRTFYDIEDIFDDREIEYDELYKKIKRITDGDFTEILDEPARRWDEFISICIEEQAWEKANCPCLNI